MRQIERHFSLRIVVTSIKEVLEQQYCLIPYISVRMLAVTSSVTTFLFKSGEIAP